MTELLTFASSYILSFLSTFIARGQQMRAEQYKHTLQLAGLKEQSTQSARAIADPYTKTTRRMLAIGAYLALIAFPVMVIALMDVPVFVEITQQKGGFWIFSSPKEVTEFVPLHGLVFLKEYQYILLAVFGLYFGNNHARG